MEPAEPANFPQSIPRPVQSGNGGEARARKSAPAEMAYFNWPIVAFTLPATAGGSGA